MRSGFHAGLIAGMVGGLSVNIARIVESILGLPTAQIGLTFDFIIFHLLTEISITGIFGAIFGIIYSKFHDRIPGKRIKKGLVFGLLIYLLSNIFIASHFVLYGIFTSDESYFLWAGQWAYPGFVTLVPYGIVLGALYKK